MANTIPLGFTYETLKIGQKSVSQGRTVSDTDHQMFMMLTGAWHPVHADIEHAREVGLEKLLVQGTFGVALALGGHLESALLHSADPFVAALGVREWSYLGPIFVGDTLHLEVEIADKKLTSDGTRYIVDRQVSVINQTGRIVQKGVARSMWQATRNPTAQ